MHPNPIDSTLGHFIILSVQFYYEFSGSLAAVGAAEASDKGTDTDRDTDRGKAMAGELWQGQKHWLSQRQ